MLTSREMLQLFHAILGQGGYAYGGRTFVDAHSVLTLLSTYCEETPKIERNKDGSFTITFPPAPGDGPAPAPPKG